MQEIYNPFHRQNDLISKEFSNFERTSSCPFYNFPSFLYTQICLFYACNGRETDFIFPGNFAVVWGLFIRLQDINHSF